MDREKVVFVRCEFFRGGFPHERVFVLRSEGGGELRGVAQVQYCYTRGRVLVGDAPPPGGSVAGLIVGIEIGRRPDGLARIYLPDSEVYELGNEFLEPTRAEDRGPDPRPVRLEEV